MWNRLPFVIVHPVNERGYSLVNLALVSSIRWVTPVAGGGCEVVLNDHSIWCRESVDQMLNAIQGLEGAGNDA